VIGRYDICEVLPVVASIESETGSYKSITALVSALPRLLYGTHLLQTFVHVDFMVHLSFS